MSLGALLVKLTGLVQLSAAVGAVKITVAVQFTPAFAVIATGVVIVGTVVSITVTNCVAVAIFPEASLTVQDTIVSPNGNVTGALFITLVTEQLSVVTGVPNTNPVTPQVALDETVIAVGATMVGTDVSCIVTNCVAVAVFPAASVTVHVTVVAPIGKVVGALFVTVATVQLSAVSGVPNATFKAKQSLLVETVTAVGAVMVGTATSLTVTVCVLVVVFPDPSTAVHVTVVTPIG